MQQKLAVASVLLLAVLAGASAVMVEVHALNQTSIHSPQSASTIHTNVLTTTSTNSSSISSSAGSLLLSGHPTNSTGDDGNQTESETEYGTNMTGDS